MDPICTSSGKNIFFQKNKKMRENVFIVYILKIHFRSLSLIWPSYKISRKWRRESMLKICIIWGEMCPFTINFRNLIFRDIVNFYLKNTWLVVDEDVREMNFVLMWQCFSAPPHSSSSLAHTLKRLGLTYGISSHGFWLLQD